MRNEDTASTGCFKVSQFCVIFHMTISDEPHGVFVKTSARDRSRTPLTRDTHRLQRVWLCYRRVSQGQTHVICHNNGSPNRELPTKVKEQ